VELQQRFLKVLDKNIYMSLPFTDNITALGAVTADTTSDAYDLSKREQITATLTAADISAGNGVFTVDVCNGDFTVAANWITGIAFKNAVTTTTTTLVTSLTLSTNTTAGIIIPAGFRYYRIKVDVTTDGTYSAVIEAAG
jgi:hypothetical protein